MRTFKNKFAAMLGCVAAGLFGLSIAHASVVGSAYLNNSAASDAVIGFTHGAPDATFSVPSPINPACSTPLFAGDTLCFDSGYYNGVDTGGAYTLGGFLASGGATILSGSASALASNLDNTVLEFTGMVTVTTGETFVAGHDDGLQLMIGSDLVINSPGGTAFTTTADTYTGPSGTFAFDLVYGECCGPPAALGVSLPLITPAVPEPATLWLVAGGLLGLGVTVMRRRWHRS